MLILVLIAAIIIFFLEIRKNMTLDTSIEKDDPQRNLILKNAEENDEELNNSDVDVIFEVVENN